MAEIKSAAGKNHMHEKIRHRIIVPLMLGLIVLLTSFVYTSYHFQEAHIDTVVWDQVNTTKFQIYREIDLDAQFINGLIDFIEKDHDLRKAWLAKDRERLLATSLPIFESIRSQYQITHFYFHSLDHTNYLRVHNPGRNGDEIKRFTMIEAVAKQKTSHGIELGPLGTFTLRVVRPWIIDGELVGYLELGEEIEHVIKRMQDALKLDYVFLINKQQTQKESWLNGQKMMNRSENWDDYAEMAVIFRTLDMPSDILKTHLTRHNMGQENFLFSSNIQGQQYRSGFTPLVDAGGRVVGTIVLLYNTTNEMQSLRAIILKLCLFSLFSGAILIGFFWTYLGRLENRIISSRNELIEEQSKRETVSRNLLASEQKYRSIINNLQDVFYRVDFFGRLQMISPSALKILGYDSEEEILGGGIKNLLANPEDLKDLFDVLQETEGGISNYELKLKRKDNSSLLVTINSSVYFDKEGKQAGIEGIFSDISERKKLESELVQARKLESVGQLAAGIAHEINTPIQFVGTNVDFWKEANDDIFKLIETYQKVLDKARHNSLFTDDIKEIDELQDEIDLDYYKDEIPSAIEQSQGGIQRVATIVLAMKEFSHPASKDKTQNDLNKLIETTVTVASSEWKHIANLQLDLAQDLPLVDCFAGEMSQVFLNIIVNAAHAIAEKGNDKSNELIKISSLCYDNWVEVKIADSGLGIPDSAKNHIFDPFFTTKTVGKGTGQGLSIAYDIVTVKHGGELTFETIEKEGTTFIIRLPLRTQKVS